MIEKEQFLIPDDYKGMITIYFSESMGKAQKYNDKTRMYEIDVKGELRTQFPPNYGVRPMKMMSFKYKATPKNKIIPHVSTVGKDYHGVVVQGPYIVDNKLYLIIDNIDKLKDYKNPAIDENERQWK